MKLLLKWMLVLWVAMGSAHAAYPEKPIRILVPYAVGGGADAAARLIGAKMTEYLGQPVVVENRAGGNAVIGTTAIAKAEPDGYTIGMVLSAHAINPYVAKNLPYHPQNDFEPLAYVARMPGVLLVSPTFAVGSITELVTMAKRQPGKLFYAIPGGLTNGHVSMEILKQTAGIDVTPVTFRGGAPAVMEVSSGRVNMLIVAPPAAMPFIQSGRLKPLAVTGAHRLKQLDKVPTLMESGFPSIETYEWFGMLAPAGTPAAVTEKLSAAIARALREPDVVEKLGNSGLEVVNGGPAAFRRLLESELGKMRALTQAVRFEVE